MKFLLKDELVAAFRKVPKAIWYFILALSFFGRDSYSIIQEGKLTAKNYLDAFGENMLPLNDAAFIIIACITIPLVYTLFAEIIMNIVYNILARRFVMAINKEDFTFRVRITLIASNIIIGIIAITYYFVPQAIEIGSRVLAFVVPTLFFAWFYEDFRVRYVPKMHQYSLMNYVAKIYLGVVTIFSALSFIYYMFMIDVTKTTLTIVAYSLDLAIKLIFVALAYLYGKKLNKQSKEPEDNSLFIVKEQPKVDDNVFKDFNF